MNRSRYEHPVQGNYARSCANLNGSPTAQSFFGLIGPPNQTKYLMGFFAGFCGFIIVGMPGLLGGMLPPGSGPGRGH
jgi:hypothetical protein